MLVGVDDCAITVNVAFGVSLGPPGAPGAFFPQEITAITNKINANINKYFFFMPGSMYFINIIITSILIWSICQNLKWVPGNQGSNYIV